MLLFSMLLLGCGSTAHALAVPNEPVVQTTNESSPVAPRALALKDEVEVAVSTESLLAESTWRVVGLDGFKSNSSVGSGTVVFAELEGLPTVHGANSCAIIAGYSFIEWEMVGFKKIKGPTDLNLNLNRLTPYGGCGFEGDIDDPQFDDFYVGTPITVEVVDNNEVTLTWLGKRVELERLS